MSEEILGKKMNDLLEKYPAFCSFHSNMEGSFSIPLEHFGALLGIDNDEFVNVQGGEKLLMEVKKFWEAGFLMGYDPYEEMVDSYLIEDSIIYPYSKDWRTL